VLMGMNLPVERYGVTRNERFCCYKIDESLYMMILEEGENLPVERRGSLGWHAKQLERKGFEIYPESRGVFLPHRVDMHLSGYLSFDKGCYKGQEIIARMHYRATLKHELACLTIETTQKLQSGQPLYSEDGADEIGVLVDYCPVDKGRFLVLVSRST